ncbi:hypothetical protein HK098_005179 [Nowakowskiella sp. JEL0407]|nr:hypothetical protein HK098_005179 [Nowakowskiella sp. JEL0407]
MKLFVAVAAFLFLIHPALALPAQEKTDALPVAHNCMADVIFESRRLQKRAEPAFGYEGAQGPAHWAELNPKFSACGSGQLQSPINFIGDVFRYNGTTRPFTLSWREVYQTAEFLNEGITIKVLLNDTSSKVVFENEDYILKQFHIHVPSEHHFDGHHYDAEIHFVHISASGKILVLGAMVDIQQFCPPNPFLKQLLPRLPIGPVDTKTQLTNLDMFYMINFFKGSIWHTYVGSLTAPPCTEGVRFFISTKKFPVTDADLEKIKSIVTFNSRYTQPYNGRGGLERK